MTEQSAKKPRTPAQAAANLAASERAKRVAQESAEFFAKYGLLARVPYPGMYAKMKKEGKSDDEIAAALKQKQNNNAATRKTKTPAKSAAKTAAVVANAKPANSVANSNSVANTTAKVKSAAKNAANKAQSNTAKKFKNRNLKAYPQAVSYYIAQKKAGMNDEAIFSEIKGRPNLQKAPVRTKRNNAAKKANAVVAPLAVANATVSNKGVAKGSYVCEKCRYVANNTTRKNNNKKNNYTSNNFFPVNATNFNGANL
jgi:hypothetical protein